MRRLLLVAVTATLLVGCDDDNWRHENLGTFFLSSIDGDPLPAHPVDLPEGYLVEAATLAFISTNRPREPDDEFVTYTTVMRRPDGEIDQSSVQLVYTYDGFHITIDLCPPLALCLVPTVLVGTVRHGVMVLTHYYANDPKSVYRYYRSLPD